MTLLLHQMN